MGDNNYGVIHRALFAEVGHDLGDGGAALADGTVNTDHVFRALIQDGVNRNGRFARLPVTEN